MAAPEALLNTIGSTTPTSKNLLEKLGEAPFSGADGPSFSSAMREASASTQGNGDATAAEESEETGKGLPDLPDRPSVRARLSLVPTSEQKLEEFAVDMGIDRDLARLLLSETAPAVEMETAETVPDPVSDPMLADTSTATQFVAAAPVPVPAPVSTTMFESLGAARPGVVAVDDATSSALNSTLESDGAAVTTTTSPMTTSPIVTTRTAPIADEDVLMWRSRLSSLMAMESSTTAPTVAAPANHTGGASASSSIAIPVTASTIGQLRARSATMSDVVSATAVASISDVSTEPRGTLSRETSPTSTSDWLSPRISESVSASGVVAATAETSGESAFNERPSDQRSPTTPLRSAAGTEMFLSMTAPAPLVELTDLSSAVPLGSMMRDTATGVPAVSIAAGETSRVLSTPDPKLSFGERVQAFADAVAQRVLGQIRDENWSVTLQLEPANMGVMDIDLSMRGNAVVANVGVASGEVRALLESGLPRLRDSMESAGLQLAGWTFGQSGSRAFSDPARKMFTQASFRGRVDDVDSVSEAGVSRVMRAKDLASGAVDLFV